MFKAFVREARGSQDVISFEFQDGVSKCTTPQTNNGTSRCPIYWLPEHTMPTQTSINAEHVRYATDNALVIPLSFAGVLLSK
jgi:hypothetical protein